MPKGKEKSGISRKGMRNVRRKSSGSSPETPNKPLARGTSSPQGATLHHETAKKLAITPQDFIKSSFLKSLKSPSSGWDNHLKESSTEDWQKMAEDILGKLDKLSKDAEKFRKVQKKSQKIRKVKTKHTPKISPPPSSPKVTRQGLKNVEKTSRLDPSIAIYGRSELDKTLDVLKSAKIENGISAYDWAKSGKRKKDLAPPVIMTIVGQKCFLHDINGKLVGDPGDYFRGTAGTFLEPGTWMAMPGKKMYLRLEDRKEVPGFMGKAGVDRGLINYFATSPSTAVAVNELTRGRSLFVHVVNEKDKMAATDKILKVSEAFIRSFEAENLGHAFKEIGKYFADLRNAPEIIATTAIGFSRFGYFLMLPMAKDQGNAVAVAAGAETNLEIDLSAQMFARIWGALGVALFLSIAAKFVAPRVIKGIESRLEKTGYKPQSEKRSTTRQETLPTHRREPTQTKPREGSARPPRKSSTEVKGELLIQPKLENPSVTFLKELKTIYSDWKAGRIKKYVTFQNKVKELVGETGAKRYIMDHYDTIKELLVIPRRGEKGPPILDIVFETSQRKIIVVEAKGGMSARLGKVREKKFGATDAAGTGNATRIKGDISVKQMSRRWLQERINEIFPKNHRLANKIQRALADGRIEGYTIRSTLKEGKLDTKLLKDHTVEWRQSQRKGEAKKQSRELPEIRQSTDQSPEKDQILREKNIRERL